MQSEQVSSRSRSRFGLAFDPRLVRPACSRKRGFRPIRLAECVRDGTISAVAWNARGGAHSVACARCDRFAADDYRAVDAEGCSDRDDDCDGAMPRLETDNRNDATSAARYLTETIRRDPPRSAARFRANVESRASGGSATRAEDAGAVPPIDAHPNVNMYCGGELRGGVGGTAERLGDREVFGLSYVRTSVACGRQCKWRWHLRGGPAGAADDRQRILGFEVRRELR